MYSSFLNEEISSIHVTDLSDVLDNNAVASVNNICDKLCVAMHNSVRKCQEVNSYKKHKKKHWWDMTCTAARNRNRLFRYIWKSMNQPRTGHIFECYKSARKSFRKACRSAINKQTRNHTFLLDKMCKEKRSGHLWNLIRKTKQSEDTTSAIQLETFEHHFQGEFKKPSDLSQFAQAAQVSVDNKIEHIRRNPAGRNFQMSIRRVKRYIHALKSGSAGLDGITSEHLKFGMETKLPYYLSNMLSICVQSVSIMQKVLLYIYAVWTLKRLLMGFPTLFYFINWQM